MQDLCQCLPQAENKNLHNPFKLWSLACVSVFDFICQILYQVMFTLYYHKTTLVKIFFSLVDILAGSRFPPLFLSIHRTLGVKWITPLMAANCWVPVKTLATVHPENLIQQSSGEAVQIPWISTGCSSLNERSIRPAGGCTGITSGVSTHQPPAETDIWDLRANTKWLLLEQKANIHNGTNGGTNKLSHTLTL